MSAILFSRAIGPVPVSCVISENHVAELGITEIPIETGAKITDHSFVMPKKITLDVADENAAATWNALVRFQETRAPFTMVSGLMVYKNMLIKTLTADRDEKFSRVLRCTADLQEIIIVSTAYTADTGAKKSATQQNTSKSAAKDTKTADRAASTVTRGDSPSTPVPTASAGNAGSQSMLYTLTHGAD